MLARPSPLVHKVIGCAITVHRHLGPGLLESAYESCLVHELTRNQIPFQRQVPVPIAYDGAQVDCSYRADMVIDGILLLELKSVERVLPIYLAQVLTYLKLLDLRQGILMNFNETRLVDGIRNVLR